MAFSKAVAKEVGRYNVHVNASVQAFTRTPATTERLTPDLEARIVSSIPSAALVSPKMSRRLSPFWPQIAPATSPGRRSV